MLPDISGGIMSGRALSNGPGGARVTKRTACPPHDPDNPVSEFIDGEDE